MSGSPHGLDRVAFVLTVALAVSFVALPASAQRPAPGDWREFRFDNRHTGYNRFETVLSPSNVAGLQEKWESEAYAFEFSSPVVSNGTVYIAADSPYGVSAIDAATGTVRWSHKTVDPATSSPTVAGKLVYVGTTHGIMALKVTTGKQLWYLHTPAVIAAATVAHGVVYASSNVLSAIDAATGALLWRAPGAYFGSSPAVAKDVLYVGSERGLSAIDPTTGSTIWYFETDDPVSSPAVLHGVVYFECNDGTIRALNASTGALIWSRPLTTDGNDNSYASPAVARGVVYAAMGDGRLWALNATTGEVRWSRQTYASLESSPAVANGVVYVGCPGITDAVCARRASTGALLWEFDTHWADGAFSSPAVTDGRLYYAGPEYVYAFGL